MRKVTQQVTSAWWRGDSRKVSNTETDGETVWLHGNAVARMDRDAGILEISMAGWGTPTTRERINGVLHTANINAHVYQHDHEQYLRMGDRTFAMPIRRWVRITPWKMQGLVEVDHRHNVIEPEPEPRRRTLTDLILGPGFRSQNFGHPKIKEV